jgi:hypothetical protein
MVARMPVRPGSGWAGQREGQEGRQQKGGKSQAATGALPSLHVHTRNKSICEAVSQNAIKMGQLQALQSRIHHIVRAFTWG